jgi:copper transport protein
VKSASTTRTATRALILTAALVAVILTLANSLDTAAHARLEASDPAPGAVLASAPPVCRLTFTEPIDAEFSSASLLTADGQSIPIEAVATDPADHNTAVIAITDPASVSPGNYTLVWRVFSAADGHYTDGALVFSVGTGQAPGIASMLDADEQVPWWAIVANWLELAGLIAVCGVFPFGLFVALPAMRNNPGSSAIFRAALRDVWWIGFGLAIGGMAFVLIVQIGRTADGSTLAWPGFSAVRDLLIETRFGQCWLARVGLVLGLLPVAWNAFARRSNTISPGSRPWIAGAVIGAIALATLPLSGHAAAVDPVWAAVASDWVHLATVAVWLGGLVYLIAGLFSLARLERGESTLAAASLAQRFSGMALVALALVIGSGFLNAAFNVSGPRNLTSENYGLTLIIKHLIVIPVLIAAGVNLLVTVPRIKRSIAEDTHDTANYFLRALRHTVAVEFVVAVAVLVAAAALTELAPANGPLQVDVAARTASCDQHAPAGELDVWLLGRITGELSDRFTLTVSNPAGNTPDDILRVIVESDATTSSGTVSDRFDAQPLSGNPGAFTFPASRLGLSADWSLNVIVRRAGIPDAAATFTVDTQGTGLQPPRFVSDEWRFPRMTLTSWLTLMLSMMAVVGGAVGVKKLPGLEPLAAALMLMMTALITAGFLVTSYRLAIPASASTNLANPVPSDDESIQRGEALYRASCVICHGASGGGPNEETVADDPSHDHGAEADLLDAKTEQRRDSDLFDAISSGVPGTDMPAYDQALNEEDRWDLVNYVRRLQDAAR